MRFSITLRLFFRPYSRQWSMYEDWHINPLCEDCRCCFVARGEMKFTLEWRLTSLIMRKLIKCTSIELLLTCNRSQSIPLPISTSSLSIFRTPLFPIKTKIKFDYIFIFSLVYDWAWHLSTYQCMTGDFFFYGKSSDLQLSSDAEEKSRNGRWKRSDYR